MVFKDKLLNCFNKYIENDEKFNELENDIINAATDFINVYSYYSHNDYEHIQPVQNVTENLYKTLEKYDNYRDSKLIEFILNIFNMYK